MTRSTLTSTEQALRLRELATVFSKLGLLAFGGPAAHLAMMRQECVQQRQWLSDAEFISHLGMAQLIPGPNSTEMAMHLGWKRAGWPGLWVAGLCFILPAALLVTGLAWVYVRFGQLPQATRMLQMVSPVILAVVIQAIWGLLSNSLGQASRPGRLIGLGLAAGVGVGLGADEVWILLGVGGFTGARAAWQQRPTRGLRPLGLLLLGVGGLLSLAQGLQWLLSQGSERLPYAPAALFGFFLKLGAVLYGSGYVLLSFLEGSLVRDWGWLSPQQLLDAVLMGQVTPGPVFTTATFIGFVLDGSWGALLATVGIFLPGFLLVGMTAPLLTRLQADPVSAAFLEGVNVSSLTLMGVVTWQLAQSALQTPLSLGVLLASTLLLWRGVNATWLIALMVVLGLVWR